MNRDNILATIADLKAELSNIETTKKQIESSLQGLTDLLRSPLFASNKRSFSARSVEQKKTRVIPATTTQSYGGNGPVASDRVHAILENMHGRFTRSELYKNASNDGNGPIAPGTFANIFSKLIKRKQIRCVEGAPGQRDSVYQKANEIKSTNDDSSQEDLALGFDLAMQDK